MFVLQTYKNILKPLGVSAAYVASFYDYIKGFSNISKRPVPTKQQRNRLK
jgi:hypothetical protein